MPGGYGQRRAAAPVRVEHELSRVAQRKDQALHQGFWLLSWVTGALAGHGRHDSNVPHVAERGAGRLLGQRARAAPSTVFTYHRLLFSRAPSRLRRRGKGLVELVEA